MNIYVGNIPFTVTERDLEEKFGEFGTVESARIIIDRETNRSKGFGFVEMPNDEEAKQAIEQLNEQDLGGRNIKVNEARPKRDRPSRGPRY